MSSLSKKVILSALVLAVAAPAAIANPGNNNGNGWGVGKIPPGHQKKMQVIQQQQVVVPPVVIEQTPVVVQQNVLTDYVIIQQPSLYNLPALPDNQIYVQRDNEIYQIYRDTSIVVQAIGIVSELLNGG